MGTTADKLNKILQTKAEIKQAIINKGVNVSDEDTFASYPDKIASIQGGGAVTDEWYSFFTNNGTRGEYLFYNCDLFSTLNLDSLNTSEFTSMQYMFYGCTELTKLFLSNFNTSSVTSMAYMFGGCSMLSELNLSNFDTSNVTSMSYMFSRCSALTELDLSNFDTSKITNISNMFYNCTSLVSINCTGWDINNITTNLNLSGIFKYCTALVDLYPPQNINANISVEESILLSHDSLVRIINNLMETTSTKKLTLGETNLAKLTDEEKAIATNKGWTLA